MTMAQIRGWGRGIIISILEGALYLMCNTDQDAPSGVEWADLEGLHTDSEVEFYLSHRNVGNEYRGATTPGDCDVFGAFAEMYVSGHYKTRRVSLPRDLGRA